MKNGRACWMFVVLGIFACSSSERAFQDADDPSGGAGGSGGEAGGSDGEAGGDGETGGSAGTQGEAGASSVDALQPVLTGAELPEAKFNTPYTAELVEEGAGPFEFEITGGELPSGLTIDEDGNLAGTPTEDGEFDFTLRVSNAAGEDTAEFSLFVSRKPWFVYLGDGELEGQTTLYAIDTSTALLTKHVVSKGLPSTGSVSDFQFAANGRRLAYTADVTTDGVLELYLVDVEQDALGDAVKLDVGDLPVGHFALTPSGEGIVYQVKTGTDTWEMRFRDLTDLEADFVPVGPSMAAEPWHRMVWLTEERLIYTTTNANATRLRSGDTFGPEEPLEAGGVTTYPEFERAVVYNGFGTCSSVSWLYDFSDGGVVGYRAPSTGTNYAVYNNDLSLTTLTDGAGGHFVFDAEETGGEPLGLISPSSFCADVWWSPRGDRLVTTGVNYEYLQLTNIVDGELVTVPIEGDYTFTGTPNVRFAGDDRVLFTTNDAVLEFRIEDGVPTESSALVPSDEEVGSTSHLSVSGNHRWAFYTAFSLDNTGQASLLIDLTLEPPVTPRVVRAKVPSLIANLATFSPDSSVLALEQQDTNSGSEVLYLTNLLHPTAPATKVSFGGCDQWCRTVEKYQFQP